MPETRFDWVLIGLSVGFLVIVAIVMLPTFFGDGLNVFTAAEGMFHNPYASGVSIDLIFTYLVMAAWIIYENEYRGVQHGWVALVVGIALGVAVGLAVYLLIRHREIGPQTWR
jgi:hypothetical protein